MIYAFLQQKTEVGIYKKRKKKTRSRPRKRSRKNFLGFLVEGVFSFFFLLVCCYKFSPQTLSTSHYYEKSQQFFENMQPKSFLMVTNIYQTKSKRGQTIGTRYRFSKKKPPVSQKSKIFLIYPVMIRKVK